VTSCYFWCVLVHMMWIVCSKPAQVPEQPAKESRRFKEERSHSRESGERSSSDSDSDNKRRKSARDEPRRRSRESSPGLRNTRTIIRDHRRQSLNDRGWRDRGYQPSAWQQRRLSSDTRRFSRRSRSGSRERRRDSRLQASRSPVSIVAV